MLNDMPTEILIKIFGHITTGQLLTNVALVCKRFYNITKSEHTHSRVSLNYSYVMTNSNTFNIAKPMIQFLKWASQMKQLQIEKSNWHVQSMVNYSPDDVRFMYDSCCDRVIEAVTDHEHLVDIWIDKRQLHVTTLGLKLMTLSR